MQRRSTPSTCSRSELEQGDADSSVNELEALRCEVVMLRVKLAAAQLDRPDEQSRRARGIRRNMVDYKRGVEQSTTEMEKALNAEAEAVARIQQCLRGKEYHYPEFRVLRQSVYSGQWTLYSGGGATKKPDQYLLKGGIRDLRAEEQLVHDASCPFCPGNEHRTPDPLLSIDSQGRMRMGPDLPKDWRVRAIPNIFPLLVTPPGAYGESFEQKLESMPHSGVARGKHQNEKTYHRGPGFPQVDAIGFSEIVIEDPAHNGLMGIINHEQIALSLRALHERGQVLRKKDGMKQLLFFKQYGSLSGGSLLHPHFQLLALPIVAPAFYSLLERAIEHHRRKDMCNRCRFLKGEPLSLDSSRLIHRSTHFFAAVPFAGREYSVSIVPLKHGHSWLEIGQEELEDLAFVLQLVMEALYHHLDDPSYDLFIKSLDCEEMIQAWPDNIKDAFHWTLEIQPRFAAQIGGVELATGIRVGDRLPEDAAKELRGAVAERLKFRRHVTQVPDGSNNLSEAAVPSF